MIASNTSSGEGSGARLYCLEVSGVPMKLDRNTARALTEVGYMPLRDYLELFGDEDATGAIVPKASSVEHTRHLLTARDNEVGRLNAHQQLVYLAQTSEDQIRQAASASNSIDLRKGVDALFGALPRSHDWDQLKSILSSLPQADASASRLVQDCQFLPVLLRVS